MEIEFRNGRSVPQGRWKTVGGAGLRLRKDSSRAIALLLPCPETCTTAIKLRNKQTPALPLPNKRRAICCTHEACRDLRKTSRVHRHVNCLPGDARSVFVPWFGRRSLPQGGPCHGERWGSLARRHARRDDHRRRFAP